ncbi:7117_t:CDS:2, partial [Diversispora eburnea]
GIYFIFRISYHYDSFTFWIATKYLITCGISLFLWKQLVSYGTPRFRPNGSVDWPGEDLNAEGLTAYMFDVIYVTWFVHITSMFFEWAWWFYTVIPLFGAYKIWTLFIQPS